MLSKLYYYIDWRLKCIYFLVIVCVVKLIISVTLNLNIYLTVTVKIVGPATGSVFGTNLFVPEDEVKISGNLSSYSHKSDSGSTMTKMFSTNCGSLMFGRNSAKKNIMSIRANNCNPIRFN